MAPSPSRVASRHIALRREARMRTKSEVADKIQAAVTLLNGIHISGDDERIVDRVQRLLGEAAELSEDTGWL